MSSKWSAIDPLVLVVPLMATPVLEQFSLHHIRLVTTLVITGTVVFPTACVVMPHHTRAIKRWLFSR